jgi:polysaccharide deacetylase 2 family uncharacterized protein YibQ
MEWLMTELQSYPLYFVDSRTSKHTQAFNTAQAKHIPSISRDVFLDDDETPAAIRTQLERAVKLAQVRGHAVAIGHPYASTLAVLEQIEPLLKKYDTQLVFVSALLPAPLIKPKWLEKTIEHSLDYCPAPITPTDIDNTNIDLSDTIRAAIYPLLNIK